MDQRWRSPAAALDHGSSSRKPSAPAGRRNDALANQLALARQWLPRCGGLAPSRSSTGEGGPARGVEGHRSELYARGGWLAGPCGPVRRDRVDADDLQVAVGLVIAPRALCSFAARPIQSNRWSPRRRPGRAAARAAANPRRQPPERLPKITQKNSLTDNPEEHLRAPTTRETDDQNRRRHQDDNPTPGAAQVPEEFSLLDPERRSPSPRSACAVRCG